MQVNTTDPTAPKNYDFFAFDVSTFQMVAGQPPRRLQFRGAYEVVSNLVVAGDSGDAVAFASVDLDNQAGRLGARREREKGERRREAVSPRGCLSVSLPIYLSVFLSLCLFVAVCLSLFHWLFVSVGLSFLGGRVGVWEPS